MNPYIKKLNRIEFIITYACTGRCKHCSESDKDQNGEYLTADIAVRALEKINEKFPLQSVMTFGGEPLLYPETVIAIHNAAKTLNVPKRQLITNGFFSKNERTIKKVARDIAKSGANDILISADAFHQETIPLKNVLLFTETLLNNGLSAVRVHPAWLVNKDDDNPYNLKTKEILTSFEQLGVFPSNGNIVFPAGNALKYLSEYFNKNTAYVNRYEQNPKDIRAISIEPNGNFLNCNIHNEKFMDKLNKYLMEK